MSMFGRIIITAAVFAGVAHVFRRDLRRIVGALQKPTATFLADVKRELDSSSNKATEGVDKSSRRTPFPRIRLRRPRRPSLRASHLRLRLRTRRPRYLRRPLLHQRPTRRPLTFSARSATGLPRLQPRLPKPRLPLSPQYPLRLHPVLSLLLQSSPRYSPSRLLWLQYGFLRRSLSACDRRSSDRSRASGRLSQKRVRKEEKPSQRLWKML
jgi:hypothetical protein